MLTMKIVDDILEAKHCELWTVGPDESVQDALVTMSQKNVGALLVMREEKLLGILSERDYVRKMIADHRDPDLTRVSEIMTHQVITVTPTTTIEDCMKLMTRGQFRHLPVLIGEDVVGLVSLNDIVNVFIGGR
jgi:CBS domain-containing protein